MRLVRFSLGPSGPIRYGRLEGETVRPLAGPFWEGLAATGSGLPLGSVRLEPPVTPSKIIALGRNYLDHAKERNMPAPEEPLLFSKTVSSVIGPGETIRIPAWVGRTDHEAELGVVIGRRCKGLTREEAGEAVLGVTCLNDVSARELQKHDGQFTRGKGLDTFCPLGPWIETGLDYRDLFVRAELNGRLVQDGRTSRMIHPVDKIIEYISRVMTLFPGDVIATGTPAGVGPLAHGDEIVVEIEGVGRLINRVAVVESKTSREPALLQDALGDQRTGVSVEIKPAKRLSLLPPYLFKEIDRLRNEALAKGVDVINASIGDPDLPTPEAIVEAGQAAMADPANHQYPSYQGLAEFRAAVADWFKARFGPELDPEREVLTLIGSKEGVAHLPLAFVDPGDLVLCPSPAYPVYFSGTIFAGGQVQEMDLLPENGFFPDFKSIPAETARRAKLMWLNYPNNPTSAEASLDQFKAAVEFALEYGIIICHDAAYTEMTFDGYQAPSFLETPGAMECALEFHSFSKPFKMTGWRVGMALGNPELVAGLGQVKSNVDSGVFQAVQKAALTALAIPAEEVEAGQAVYRKRRETVVKGLERLGFRVWPSRATFYVWARNPAGLSSAEWATRLLTEAGIVITPGNGFGTAGEGWFRISLSTPGERLEEMIHRIEKMAL